MKKKDNGFTLIELIVVIIILSIIATYVSMRQPSSASFSLNGAIKNLLLDIRLTKTLSMSLNSNYRIVFSSTNYQIQNSSSTAFYNIAAGSDTTFLENNLEISTLTTLIFNKLGQPVDGSNNLLTTSTTITINDGTNNRSVIIEPQTGFVHD